MVRAWFHRLGTVNLTLFEVFVSLAALWWCVILWFPYDTFSLLPGTTFAPLSRVMPEWGWGIVTGILASWAVIATLKGWRAARIVLTGGHMVWWGIVATIITRANPWSAGTGIYWLMSACSGLLCAVTWAETHGEEGRRRAR